MDSVLCLEEARRVEDPSLCTNTMQARRRRTSAIIKWLEITKFLFEARSRLVCDQAANLYEVLAWSFTLKSVLRTANIFRCFLPCTNKIL